MPFIRKNKHWVFKLTGLWLGLWVLCHIPVFGAGKTTGSLLGLTQNAIPLAWATENPPVSVSKWPHEKSDLSPDPDLKFGRFNNGFRYVLLKNKEPENRVSIHLNVQSGSLHEEDNEQGLAHFLEHMLFNGSTHFPPGQLIQYFQSIGMQIGNDANARTGFIDTIYDILLPTGDAKTLDQALLVIEDYAQGALILPEELEGERKVVLSEMNNRDSASYRTFEATLKFEFPEALISKRLPIGKEDVIKSMDRALVKSFYDGHYRPDNMILVMVGNFKIQEAERLIQKRFAHMAQRGPKSPLPEFGDIHHEGLKALYHFEKEEGSTTITVETLEKVDPLPDSRKLQKQMLIQDMADQIVGYRLDDLVRQKDAPITSAAIRSGDFISRVKYAEITADCNPKNWEKALSLLEKVLRQALTFGFTPSELDRVKKEKLSGLEKAVKTATTRDSKRLARDVIHHLNTDRVFLSSLQKKELLSPVIENVTAKDLFEAFKTSWAADHRLILVTGNAEIKDVHPVKKILSVYQKSQDQTVRAPEERVIVSFPYLAKPDQKEIVVANTKHPDTGVIQIEFKNGVRLNLKQTDFKANDVSISATFGSGRSSQPQEKAGLTDLIEEVMKESGFGQINKDDLERSLAGKNSKIAFHTRQDCFAINLKTVTDEVELAFQLLYTQILDPGFRKEARELVIKRLSQEYDSLNHAVDGAMKIRGKQFLAGGDTRFGLPAPEQLNHISLDDMKEWIIPALKQAPLEINVVGDFNISDVIKSAGEYIGALPQRDARPHTASIDLPEFPVGEALDVKVDTQIPQGLVVVAYPTDDMWNIHRTRRLSVLAEVFSERLRKEIREKIGAAYSPHAYHHASRAYKGYGMLLALIQTEPGKVDQVVREVRKIAENIAEKGISQEELQYSLGPMLTHIRDIKRNNEYWMNSVLMGLKDHPEQLSWSQSIVDDYSSITKEDISQLAEIYLMNEKAATIIVLPENNNHRP